MPPAVTADLHLFRRLTNHIQQKKAEPMPFEQFDLESLDKQRRKAIAKSIRTISVEELKKLGEEIFHYADDPWRETFFRFITEDAGATFHHAITTESPLQSRGILHAMATPAVSDEHVYAKD